MSDHLITPEEMADRWDGVAVSTVMEWNRRHQWPHVRVGHSVRWTEDQYTEILRLHSAARPQAPAATALQGQTPRSAARAARKKAS